MKEFLLRSKVRYLLFILSVLAMISGCASTAPGGAGGSTPVLPWASTGLKIGYVRSDEIMQRYQEYRDAENSLRTQNRQWLTELERMEDNIQRMVSEREQLGLILSEDRRKKLDDDITNARKELQKFKSDTWYDDNSEYIKRRKELMEPIDARVNEAIWKVAEDQGLDLVFDTIAGNIVYVKPELDMTDLVIEELER